MAPFGDRFVPDSFLCITFGVYFHSMSVSLGIVGKVKVHG